GIGRRPGVDLLRVAQACARAEKVATNAWLPRDQERHRVAEAFAVTAVENSMEAEVDAVAVLMDGHVRIRCIRAAASRPEEIDRNVKLAEKGVARRVDVHSSRKLEEMRRL